MSVSSRPKGPASGIEVRLDHVLESAPTGLPLPVACWLVARVGYASVAATSTLSPAAIVVRADGGVRIASDVEAPFAYRAPEIVRGAAHSERSAVFGLGAILVELLTGRAPFARDSDLETRIAIAEEKVATLVGRVAQATSALDRIVQKALQKDAADRYAAGLELAETLDDFLEAELLEVDPEDVVAAIEAGVRGESPRAALEKGLAAAPPKASSTPKTKPSAAKPSPPKRPARPRPHGLRAPGPPPSATATPERAAAPKPRTPAKPKAETAPPKAKPAPPKPPEPPPPEPPSPEPPPPAQTDYAAAELELELEPKRISAPDKPRLDADMVSLRDARDAAGPAGITDAVVTGRGRGHPNRISSGGLELDERALVQQRARPQTTVDQEDEEEPPPNWVFRIAAGLLLLLALAIVYQFAVRPFLIGP